MRDLDYELVDIIERAKFEKFLCEKADIFEDLCMRRGIELFSEEEKGEKVYEKEKDVLNRTGTLQN